MKCGEWTAADDAREAGLYPYFKPLTNNEGTEAVIGDHHLIMIGSNNYLGLTVHPKVREAAIDAIRGVWDELHGLAVSQRHAGAASRAGAAAGQIGWARTRRWSSARASR